MKCRSGIFERLNSYLPFMELCPLVGVIIKMHISISLLKRLILHIDTTNTQQSNI